MRVSSSSRVAEPSSMRATSWSAWYDASSPADGWELLLGLSGTNPPSMRKGTATEGAATSQFPGSPEALLPSIGGSSRAYAGGEVRSRHNDDQKGGSYRNMHGDHLPGQPVAILVLPHRRLGRGQHH